MDAILAVELHLHDFVISGVAGLVGAILSHLALVPYRDAQGPLTVVAGAVLRRERAEVPKAFAHLQYLCIGVLGGLLYIAMWPWFYEHQPLGAYHSGLAALVVVSLVFLLIVEIPTRLETLPRPRRVRQRWTVAMAIYGTSLVLGFPFFARLLGPWVF